MTARAVSLMDDVDNLEAPSASERFRLIKVEGILFKLVPFIVIFFVIASIVYLWFPHSGPQAVFSGFTGLPELREPFLGQAENENIINITSSSIRQTFESFWRANKFWIVCVTLVILSCAIAISIPVFLYGTWNGSASSVLEEHHHQHDSPQEEIVSSNLQEGPTWLYGVIFLEVLLILATLCFGFWRLGVSPVADPRRKPFRMEDEDLDVGYSSHESSSDSSD